MVYWSVILCSSPRKHCLF